MKSRLIYRFPGKEKITQFGKFIPLNDQMPINGFVLTSFDFEESYVFEPSENVDEFGRVFPKKPYVMTAREYYLQAHELLNGMNVMQMEKAVFSRIKQSKFDARKIDVLLDLLCETYPNAFVYLFEDAVLGTWFGASPEILMEVHKGVLFTTAIAGTKQNIEDKWGEKEHHEQEIVTDYILQTLTKKGLTAIEAIGPYDYQAGPVVHLKTDISADIGLVSLWDLAKRLHPTPATGGYPKDQAIELIHSVEPHQRLFYTGLIGLMSEQKTQLFVNLRCAQIQGDDAFLYLGGGYTLQSIPELEWIETENKSKTLLNCMQKVMEL